MNQLKIREKTLINFLRAIEERYNSDVSYHNHVHAADVTQSLHVLLQMGAKNFTEEKLELFSMLIAAVVHDVGHNGLNNSFHASRGGARVGALDSPRASATFHLRNRGSPGNISR